jgi:hypothetical protein
MLRNPYMVRFAATFNKVNRVMYVLGVLLVSRCARLPCFQVAHRQVTVQFYVQTSLRQHISVRWNN